MTTQPQVPQSDSTRHKSQWTLWPLNPKFPTPIVQKTQTGFTFTVAMMATIMFHVESAKMHCTQNAPFKLNSKHKANSKCHKTETMCLNYERCSDRYSRRCTRESAHFQRQSGCSYPITTLTLHSIIIIIIIAESHLNTNTEMPVTDFVHFAIAPDPIA